MLASRWRMSFESLEDRQMLSVNVVEQENNDSSSRANFFSLGEDGTAILTGGLSVSDNRDYFRFTPQGDLTRTLSFAVLTGSGIRPDFEIQNAAGLTIAETDPRHGVNSGSVTLTLGETYYARLDGETGYEVLLSLPPVTHAVSDAAAALEEGASITIDVLANDIGTSPSDTKSLVSIDGFGLHGSVSPAPNGAGVIYTPGVIPGLEVGQTIVESFRYTMSYAEGARQATTNVHVTVTGANHAPLAINDTWTASEDSGVIVIPVLSNDTDIDLGDSKSVVAVQSNGAAGIVQVASGGAGILFYPNGAYQTLRAGQSMVETVTYAMADRAGVQSTATLVLTITGANDAPRAVSNSATVSEDDHDVLLDVLSDDTDIDVGDSRTIVAVDGSATPGGYYFVCVCGGGACVPLWIPGMPAIRGTVRVAPDGQNVIYSPGNAFQRLRAGESATEVFRYTIRDHDGLESTAHVIVTVLGRNETVPTLYRQLAFAESNELLRTGTTNGITGLIKPNYDTSMEVHVGGTSPSTVKPDSSVSTLMHPVANRGATEKSHETHIDAFFSVLEFDEIGGKRPLSSERHHPAHKDGAVAF